MIGKKIDELIEKINSIDAVYFWWGLGFWILLVLAISEAL